MKEIKGQRAGDLHFDDLVKDPKTGRMVFVRDVAHALEPSDRVTLYVQVEAGELKEQICTT